MTPRSGGTELLNLLCQKSGRVFLWILNGPLTFFNSVPCSLRYLIVVNPCPMSGGPCIQDYPRILDHITQHLQSSRMIRAKGDMTEGSGVVMAQAGARGFIFRAFNNLLHQFYLGDGHLEFWGGDQQGLKGVFRCWTRVFWPIEPILSRQEIIGN